MSAYETGEMFGKIIAMVVVLLMAVGGVVFCVVCIRKAIKGGGGGWIAGAIVSGFVALAGLFGTLGTAVALAAPAILKARNEAVEKKGETLVTSGDGSLSLAIPANWKVALTPFNEEAELCVESPLQRVCAMVLRDFKEDFAGDLAEFDELTVSSMEGALEGAVVSEGEERTVDGCPAIYRRLTGETENLNIIYHRLSVETGDGFVQVMVWTTPTREKAELETMLRVMESFTSVAGPPR